jgi:uncharacterized membrane protein YphA (DoxX/SURF4 family)
MNNGNRTTNMFVTLTLTGIRIVLGVFWLLQLTWKPPPNFGCPDKGFCFWLDQEIQHPLIPLYGEFIGAVVRPHAILFGWMTTVTEVLIGLSLIFGVFTRLGALVGTLWGLNLLIGLAKVPNEQPWYYAFIVLLNFLYVALGGSGQISVDRAKGWRLWWGRAGHSIGGPA